MCKAEPLLLSGRIQLTNPSGKDKYMVRRQLEDALGRFMCSRQLDDAAMRASSAEAKPVVQTASEDSDAAKLYRQQFRERQQARRRGHKYAGHRLDRWCPWPKLRPVAALHMLRRSLGWP
jgi:hypothetical protein